jgi:multiple sugar transport system permease protein
MPRTAQIQHNHRVLCGNYSGHSPHTQVEKWVTAVPGLISAGIFSFTLSWNEFIYAPAFIQSSANKTVPVAILTELVSGDVYQWGRADGRLAAGCQFYSLFVDYYVSSLTGAMKE